MQAHDISNYFVDDGFDELFSFEENVSFVENKILIWDSYATILVSILM